MPTTETVETLLAELHSLGKASRSLLGRYPGPGLTLATASVLNVLARTGEHRCGDVAALMGVDASVVSRQLAELERHGYAGRRPDPADGRASLSFATDAGRELLVQLRESHARSVAESLSEWSDDEISDLTHRLRRLGSDLHQTRKALA
jgi:DNA-binding MarR family transcriptional regulator